MENKVLKEKFVDERTGIEYRLVGDYYKQEDREKDLDTER